MRWYGIGAAGVAWIVRHLWFMWHGCVYGEGLRLAAWGSVHVGCAWWRGVQQHRFFSAGCSGQQIGVGLGSSLFDCLMWGVCGVDWAVKGVRGSDDSFCGMGVFNLGLQHEIHRIWLWHLCFCWCQRVIDYRRK